MSSSVVDEDTARAVNSARSSIRAMLSTAQSHLQKAFLVFVAGLLGTIWALRAFIWDELERITKASMEAEVAEEVVIIAVTPFDVILLQVKIGLFVGVLMAIPVVLYYSRDELRQRGLLPSAPIARWKLAFMGVLSAILFVIGVLYGYYVFFPIMFNFLAVNAVQAELSPTYSIVDWTQFIVLLTASFGFAAQLPLAMTTLSYSGIVPYETFRDKWRYAIVGIFVFGAFFSPPDPFTQIMWAVPLIILYAFSLYLARIATFARRGGDEIDVRELFYKRWNVLLGSAVVGWLAAYGALTAGALSEANDLLTWAGSDYRLPTLETVLPLAADENAMILAAIAALIVLVAALMYLVYVELAAVNRDVQAPGRSNEPEAIDLGPLDAAGVEAAPARAFEAMTEEDALRYAHDAKEEGDVEKARAILDRYDAVAEAEDEGEETEDDADDAEAPDEDRDVVSETATGMVGAFAGEDTDEDDIGGYYYDIQFILDSLTSKMFRIVAVFMIVLGAVFFGLYSGGLGLIKEQFLARVPEEAQAGAEIDIIVLHPVEALLFMVKMSVIAGVVVVFPMVLYYAWPAMKDRGLATGDRDIVLPWSIALSVGFVGGSVLGFFVIAPAVISYLVYDAISAGMIISYRVNSFFWMVFLLTVGIGLLANIPMSMAMFERGGLISVETMYDRWREFAIAVFILSAVLTPGSVLSMLLLALPVVIAYWIGLLALWGLRFVTDGKPPFMPAKPMG